MRLSSRVAVKGPTPAFTQLGKEFGFDAISLTLAFLELLF